jgi:hydrogenase maturation factor
MCLMAPVRVVAVEPGSCLVEVGDHVERVATLPLAGDGPSVGDWLVVAGSLAIRRLEPDQARLVTEAVDRARGSSTDEPHRP